MSPDAVRISAPCRIHFGLLAPGNAGDLQYGGAGVMVDRPRVELRMKPSPATRTDGPHAARVLEFIRVWREYTGVTAHVSCDVADAPPAHVGLGLGTQLGLAVASGLDALCGRDSVTIEQRARSVRRGKRSGVGTYGFYEGGLIVERGKQPGQWLGPMWERIELPHAWRLLLVSPRGQAGLAGEAENQAFDHLPVVPDATCRALRNELFERLVPAARRGDFGRFSESVYRYGVMAGECFATYQSGPFASPEIAQLVDWFRRAGAVGVGQSSWGPTVFSWFPESTSATTVASRFQSEFAHLQTEIIVTSIARHGARVVVE